MSETMTVGAATAASGAAESGVMAASGAAGVAGLVDLLIERALTLAGQTPRAPSAVRISAGAVRVEICWPADGGSRAGGEAAQPSVRMTNENGAHGTAGLPAAPDAAADVFPLCADTVGTFYRAPEPGAAPFVAEGDTVRPGQQVAIIEAMKLMIPVEAARAGQVVEFLVADRAPVEYGQPLILLREAGQ